MCAQEALALLLDGVHEFNACVPPAGVPPATRLDGQAAASLAAALPPELHPGLPPPAHLGADEVKQVGVGLWACTCVYACACMSATNTTAAPACPQPTSPQPNQFPSNQTRPPPAAQAVAVLQCLHRLSASPDCMDTLLALPGISPRLWAAYGCGNEAVAAEAARLMGRWWAPHAARRGAGECS